MGLRVVKTSFKNAYVIPLVLVFILIVPYVMFFEAKEKPKGELINWSSIIMSEHLPKPDWEYGDEWENSADELNIYFNYVSKDEYRAYLAGCKEFGYTIDANTTSGYTAYNADGYLLSLSYWDYSERIDIKLLDPVKDNVIVWPVTDLLKDVPVPSNLIGEVVVESSKKYIVYITGVSKEEYDQYVDLCLANDFDYDYNRSDSVFSAYDTSGLFGNKHNRRIDVEYIGFCTMSISISDNS